MNTCFIRDLQLQDDNYLNYTNVLILYIQVELAHGGRGPSSFDRSSSYSSAGQRGASKRSDYRGLYFLFPNFKASAT